MLRLFRQPIIRWLTLLAVCDLLLLAGSLNIATWIRFAPSPEDLTVSEQTLAARAAMFATVIFLGMSALGEYRSTLRMSWRGQLARHAIAFALGGMVLIVGYYVVPAAYVGRGVLGMALVIGFVTTSTFRGIFMRLVEIDALKRRVVVLGAGQRAAQIHNRMRRRSDRRGFYLVGYVPSPSEITLVPDALLIRDVTCLAELARRQRLDEIVVGVDDRRGSLPMEQLLKCRQLGVQITDLTTFVEREAGRVQLTMLDPSWLVFSGGFNATPVAVFTKRAFDIVSALAIALLCWPIMACVALAIRIESGAGQPILYRQERVGEHGRTFWLYKFRSMRTDAERDGIARWASTHDDRVTRVGRICRKLRFDELPQLWNVVCGDMSIVGPRPERPQFVTDLETKIRFYHLRHSIKPGLAGWAQLSYPYGASEEDAAEKLKYDLFYVKNHSLFLDLVILIETVEVVLFGRGAR
jgi:sugar transferase (PEP-CTERM system associated)